MTVMQQMEIARKRGLTKVLCPDCLKKAVAREA